MKQKTMSVAEAAAVLGVTASTVYRLIGKQLRVANPGVRPFVVWSRDVLEVQRKRKAKAQIRETRLKDALAVVERKIR